MDGLYFPTRPGGTRLFRRYRDPAVPAGCDRLAPPISTGVPVAKSIEGTILIFPNHEAEDVHSHAARILDRDTGIQ
jgi:hypothetical protein